MRFLLSCLAFGLTLSGRALSKVLPVPEELTYEDVVKRQVADPDCQHGPFSRQCWGTGYSIATDFDVKTPPEGVTRTYNLEITNTTLAPDGFERPVMLVDGKYPGTVLEANWGDTMVINVKNSLDWNGTSIHWHGIRQLNTNQHDGVNGITECPIAPGETKVYTFRCTQHGTSWYHSHFSAQYGDGIVGSIVINGPATRNYDIDLGPLPITDWFHKSVFVLSLDALHVPGPPPAGQGGLINGTMKTADGGKYAVTKVKKGKKHRIRLINTSVDNTFHVSIDKHKFEVISADFVPIKPFVTDSVVMTVGQRYDIILQADQDIGNYWLRADVATACGGNVAPNSIRSIIRYETAPENDPTTQRVGAIKTACYDEDVRPFVDNQVPKDQFIAALDSVSLDFNAGTTDTGRPLTQWLINGTAMRVNWNRPSLQYVLDGNRDFPDEFNVFDIDDAKDAWSFWIIQTVDGDQAQLEHPIHLHGHDYYIMGSGTGQWDGNVDALRFSNPMRRDTATLPRGGYLIMGFPVDNPGVWLVHCHIAWHVGQGLSLQFLEQPDRIKGAIGDVSEMEKGCSSWGDYYPDESPYLMDDSGLKKL